MNHYYISVISKPSMYIIFFKIYSDIINWNDNPATILLVIKYFIDSDIGLWKQ